MKRRKVLSITLDGFRIECHKLLDDQINPYRVYRIHSGGKRKQIAKYADFVSVMCLLKDIFVWGIDSMSMSDLINYCKTEHKPL